MTSNVLSDRSNLLTLDSTPEILSAITGLQDPIVNSTPRSSLSKIAVINPYPPILLDPGNTIDTARDLGLVNGVQTIAQFVGANDSADFYHVTLGSANLNVTLTGMSADADLRVIRDLNHNGVLDAGELLASSTRSGNHDESITLSGLVQGDYVIQVSQYIGDTHYKLRLSDGVPNDLLAIETDIGALLDTKTFSGVINNLNSNDDYRFSVSDHLNNGIAVATNVEIYLSGLSSQADLWLIRDANGNGIVDQNDIVIGSFSGGPIESIHQSLSTGTYFVQVSQDIGNTNYQLSLSTGDWFSDHLQDTGLIAEGRYDYFSDGSLSRTDIISLFRNTKDGGVIDANEFNDLQTMLHNPWFLGIPSYVYALAGKVLNDQVANISSGIGNLAPGSSANQMEKLIGKWFLGTDHPIAISHDRTTIYGYQAISGNLFQNGASYQDVHQGDVDDGYFLSALAATAVQDPHFLDQIFFDQGPNQFGFSNMFIDNGDNTFTIRFLGQGIVDFVTVDRYLPTDAAGNAVFAGWGGGKYTNANNELWVALAEKAYAQMNESSWIGQDNTNSYNGIKTVMIPVIGNTSGINGGSSFNTLTQITGQHATSHGMVKSSFPGGIVYSVSDLINAFNAGKLITVNAKNGISPVLSGVHNQSYTLVGYNSVTHLFHLFNPLNSQDVELTSQQLIDGFDGWETTV